ncbi:LPS-assembly protein LptD [Aurantimonas sp. VKM B-3413]|uniref:LPS-assembly protein LptD n=1 Tax=Aurantimonas sp. VKM B-3413 TaxID=2779401 RepID=UPI001E28E30E|nr:LPS-assembly protein LptD [Aurantimonas sp. VKM B-3413]MCB8836009.1 LPS-assembly protein LptD [Aurantimonas sp. VKM B-3413]
MNLRGTKGARGIAARPRSRAILLAGTAIALISSGYAAFAQSALPIAVAETSAQKDAKLYLESDTVTYDTDTSIVTASGGVKIDYGSYKLVARRIVYNQQTRRLMASGDVELQQPDGNRIYADTMDITDDFRDGFVKALRIETPDNTRFAAAGAVRQNGDTTTFEQGVYTACEPCREHPERAPLWQVKARKIVWDQKEKEVRYYGARFEIYGAPIAYLPYFEAPDPTVKRKTGFLTPEFRSSSKLGYGVRVPYYIVLSDDKDVTLTGTYYTKQGFLAEAEYRQAFENGIFTLKTAGIHQQEPEEFASDNVYYNGVLARRSPDYRDNRGMIGSTGRFALSDQWTFGWDILAQTDRDFANTYDIPGFSDRLHTSEVYLTGLGDQSFFDLRAQKFDYQTIDPSNERQQPLVLPSLDYQRIEQEPTFGGEVEFNANITSITRSEDSVSQICDTSLIITTSKTCAAPDNGYQYDLNHLRYAGLEGNYTRGTAEMEWRDSYILPSGLVLNPSASLRGDVYSADMSSDGASDPFYLNGVYQGSTGYGAVDIDNSGFRGMATAALEARYPYLIETAYGSHIIEPIGQIILRPNETDIGLLPNEDAQTLVFNTGNLFQIDKFSGYDRIEGGTRANLGVRYAGVFENGYTIDAVVGQSYHLAGINSYAQRDLALVGYDSGLETDRSDYVASLAFGSPIGLTIGAQERFDQSSFALKRSDIYGGYADEIGSATLGYTYIAAQPTYGSIEDRSQVSASASLKFATNWTAAGSIGYDIQNDAFVSKSVSVGYTGDCYSLLLSYTDTTDRYSLESSSSKLMFTLGLRTISNFSQSYDLKSGS